MQQKPRFSDRLRYQIDNLFSRGTVALIIWLAILSAIIIFVAGAVIAALQIAPEGETPLTFGEAVWRSLMRTLDAGTMGGDTGTEFRWVEFLVTVGGVFVISTLIGILSAAVENRFDSLRRGRSKVIENNHIVILGWSQQIFTIISELVIANENQKKSCIVIMGDHDKVEMEEEIRQKVGTTRKTRLVCRNGNPIELADLDLVSLNTARVIIIPSPESEDADSEVIKTVLAITNHPDRRKDEYHIVAEIRNPKNFEIAHVVGKAEVEWIQVGDFIARIIAQTCRQSGLSVVYTELLDFGGDEIYFYKDANLTGKTFGDTINLFEKNAVMGLCPKNGVPTLNPPMDTILEEGDQLIVIAEDDDKIFLTGEGPKIEGDRIVMDNLKTGKPEHIVVLGWNWRAPILIRELDNYVYQGSDILIVAEEENLNEILANECPQMKNQTVTTRNGDITDRRLLDQLNLGHFDYIILLSNSDRSERQQADSQTLITLLHMRDIADKQGLDFSIVSEMLDVRNRNLADVTRADDFIVSDKLVSLMLAQVAENKQLNAVFTDLFDPEGSEIYLKPAGRYIQVGQSVLFATVVEAARQRGELAIGYRIKSQSQDASRSYGVVVNPAKSQPVTLTEKDSIIVIAES